MQLPAEVQWHVERCGGRGRRVTNRRIAYLNNRIDLPQATRDRIDAAIAKLDYRPNLLARACLPQAEAISLVSPDIANPFFAELAAAVEREAHAHGYAIYISSTSGDLDQETDAIRTDGGTAMSTASS